MINSFRHDRKKKEGRRKVLLVTLVVLVVLFFVRGFISDPLSRVSQKVFSPLWSVTRGMGEYLRGWGILVQKKNDLSAENMRLREELDAVRMEAYTRDLLRDENEALKEMLGRYPEGDLLLATVLVRPARSPYDTLVIDVGRLHGAHVGSRVLTDGDLVLGEIVTVNDRSSVVRLYSSPGTELSVMVGSSTPIAATAQGIGGGNFLISLPRDTAIVPGDLVLVPSIGTVFSGIVERVETTDVSSFAFIYFKIPVNWNTLRYVYVENDLLGANADRAMP